MNAWIQTGGHLPLLDYWVPQKIHALLSHIQLDDFLVLSFSIFDASDLFNICENYVTDVAQPVLKKSVISR